MKIIVYFVNKFTTSPIGLKTVGNLIKKKLKLSDWRYQIRKTLKKCVNYWVGTHVCAHLKSEFYLYMAQNLTEHRYISYIGKAKNGFRKFILLNFSFYRLRSCLSNCQHFYRMLQSSFHLKMLNGGLGIAHQPCYLSVKDGIN